MEKINRRGFLKIGGLFTGGALLAQKLVAAQAPASIPSSLPASPALACANVRASAALRVVLVQDHLDARTLAMYDGPDKDTTMWVANDGGPTRVAPLSSFPMANGGVVEWAMRRSPTPDAPAQTSLNMAAVTLPFLPLASQAEENRKIVEMLMACDSPGHEVSISRAGIEESNRTKDGWWLKRLTLNGLNRAFATIEMHDLRVSNLVVHPSMVSEFKTMAERGICDMSNVAGGHNPGHVAYFWGANVLSCDEAPKDHVILLAEPDYLGSLAVRPDGEFGIFVQDCAVSRLKLAS